MDEVFINWAINELGGADITERERHGDQSTVYRIRTPRDSYFLKIAPDLAAEHERLHWLENKLPAPKVISFIHIEDKDVLLLSAIEGKNLAVLKNEWAAEKVVEKLAGALLRFHETKTRDCPFGNPGRNKVLVHGDACLPNFIFNGDIFSGYIDLGDMRIDTSDVDLAAAVWSLDHNLGPGYGLPFLKKYGVRNPDEELVEKLKAQYEAMQNEWFPQKPKIYFITGVCGVGKTAILKALKNILSEKTYDFHDLDERGYKSVEGWRRGELNFFKKQAEENLKKGITTFISGFSIPNEIFNSPEEKDYTKIILLHADPETVKKRIFGRYSTKKEKKAFLQKHNKTVEKFADDNASYVLTLKKDLEPHAVYIIDTSDLSPEDIAQKIDKELE